jgi:hypothetical protein
VISIYRQHRFDALTASTDNINAPAGTDLQPTHKIYPPGAQIPICADADRL